mgnify:CR=1 FL=1
MLHKKIESILPLVQKHARYTGGELNSVVKNKDDIELLRNWIEGLKSQKYDDVFLFLVSDETSVDKKLENLIPKDIYNYLQN